MIIETLDNKKYNIESENKEEILEEISGILEIPTEKLYLHNNIIITTDLDQDILNEEEEISQKEISEKFKNILEKIKNCENIEHISLNKEECGVISENMEEYVKNYMNLEFLSNDDL